ncbi:hypothetical protein D8674_019268 [Pyrus ussuriensis x Pyrus communis]|uniref:Uncharacterized protein n=1 Tax=Pyrus ussuriensis x Pyrus communis TaxID=2448454 RepID=A0A5N5G795_9ROSA|nr:hypothetical protein D8674_019268 [Pyrus ussuriensis x Pyrus communis]
MKARRKKGSKFPKIDVFADVYVRHGDELTQSLHESASQLPSDTPIEFVDPLEDAGFHILTEMLDQTFDRRPGTYCWGMGNVKRWESGASSSSYSKGQVTALMQEVAGLRSELASYKSQMSMLVQALKSSRIRLPSFSTPPPLEPFHIEHAHNQARRPPTSSPTLPPISSKITKHLRTTCL